MRPQPPSARAHQGGVPRQCRRTAGPQGLTEHPGSKPRRLSGGRSQRVALARALATSPASCFSTNHSPPATRAPAWSTGPTPPLPGRVRGRLGPRHTRSAGRHGAGRPHGGRRGRPHRPGGHPLRHRAPSSYGLHRPAGRPRPLHGPGRRSHRVPSGRGPRHHHHRGPLRPGFVAFRAGRGHPLP